MTQVTHQIKTNALNNIAVLKVEIDGQLHTVETFETLPIFGTSQYTPLQNAKKYGPSDVAGVEVVETWRGGGVVKVIWTNGEADNKDFGKRKPGTTGKKTGARSFPRSSQRDGRRRGY